MKPNLIVTIFLILMALLGGYLLGISVSRSPSPYNRVALENDVIRMRDDLTSIEQATINCERLSLKIGLSQEQIKEVKLGEFGCNQAFIFDKARKLVVEPELREIKETYLTAINLFEVYSYIMLFNSDPILSSGELDRRHQTDVKRAEIFQTISSTRDALLEIKRIYDLEIVLR